MKILHLGPPDNEVYFFLKKNYTFTSTEKIITPKLISKFDWVVSYGYKHLLKKEHLGSAKNPIINLHISYLPWNRGADPNYWSWVEDTPKGVTIHIIDEGIDTGDILIQKRVDFTENDTLVSSYFKLKKEIEKLFKNNFDSITKNSILPQKQIGEGTIHYKKDSPKIDSWDIKVKDLIK
jgi:methionyl-tRNA formyltransferase